MQKKYNPYLIVYLSSISIISISALAIIHPVHFIDTFHSLMSVTILGAILLLSHFSITFPQEDKNISLDSAVFLAILFVYGLDLTIHVFVLHGIIYSLWKRKIQLWKHLYNFSTFTIMILTAYFVFIGSGGSIGHIRSENLLPYILSLSAYFTVNMASVVFTSFWQKIKKSFR